MPLPRTRVASPEWIAGQNPGDWLSQTEQAIYGGWRSETRRTEWLAGRLAAKRLLQEELGIAPLSWSVGRDGVAPALDGLHLPNTRLSLSHSAGWGAATLSDLYAEGSAGIDIQRIRPVHPGLCARVFTPGEREQIAARFGAEDSAEGMLLVWALKEAAIKARRLPWGSALNSIEVRLIGAGESEIILSGEPPLTAQYERYGHWWLARAVQPAVKLAADKEPPPDIFLRDQSSSGESHLSICRGAEYRPSTARTDDLCKTDGVSE